MCSRPFFKVVPILGSWHSNIFPWKSLVLDQDFSILALLVFWIRQFLFWGFCCVASLARCQQHVPPSDNNQKCFQAMPNFPWQRTPQMMDVSLSFLLHIPKEFLLCPSSQSRCWGYHSVQVRQKCLCFRELTFKQKR